MLHTALEYHAVPRLLLLRLLIPPWPDGARAVASSHVQYPTRISAPPLARSVAWSCFCPSHTHDLHLLFRSSPASTQRSVRVSAALLVDAPAPLSLTRFVWQIAWVSAACHFISSRDSGRSDRRVATAAVTERGRMVRKRGEVAVETHGSL